MKSYHIIIIIISFIVGFFIGRKTISEEITVLVPQKPISGQLGRDDLGECVRVLWSC